MFLPILASKLYIPHPDAIITRPKLFERLNGGLDHKLILLAASAGSGKTSLVSAWLREINLPVAWLSLDAADSDPVRFIAYLVAACQKIEPNIGQSILNLIQTPQLPPIETIMTLFIDDFTNRVTDDHSLLVLDDYHFIEAKSVHEAIRFLLNHMPHQLHLVLITREDPPLPLPQLRVQRQITELRATDLRFTSAEATEFFRVTTNNLNLSTEDIIALEHRTEGWAAGLQLAALSLQNNTNPGEFIKDFAGDDHYVVDYLISEVLNHQPPHIQEFLLKTAFLERLTAPLCNAVTRQDDGQNCLAYLQHANLFLVSLDNKREWYRYHHLFADLLSYRLKEVVGTEGIKQLHQRAASWYAQNDFIDEGIRHYLIAEDFAQGADLMEAVSISLIVQGQLRKVCNWLEALPDTFIRTRSLLCVCHALALNLSGQADAVAPRLQDAEQSLLIAPPAQRQNIQALIHFVQAFLARRENNMPLSTEYLRRAAEGLSQDNLAVRASVNLNLGFNYYLAGQLPQADQTLQAAQVDGQASQAIYITLIAMAMQANTYVVRGKLRQAMALYEKAIAYGLDHNDGRPFPPAGYAYAGLGQVLIERNDLTRAEPCLVQAVDLGEFMADWSMTRRGLLPLAWLKQIQGDHAAAQALWQRALSVVQQAESKRIEAQLRVHQARLWLAQATTSADESALASATAWAEVYQQNKPDPAGYSQVLAQLTLAWLRLLQGQPDQVLAGLEPVAAAAVAGGHRDNLIKILALQTLAHTALDDLERALATLQQSFEMTAPEGYIRTFIDLGPPMQHLLQQAAAQGIAPAYVAQLLRNFPASSEDKPAVNLIEPLNDREESILRLMAAGLSNREIAEELYLSVNTIKWYSTHIYAKLGVNSRAKAVACAQEAGLL